MRFYNPTPRQYESTLVDTRLPYDFLAGAIKGKQQEYDETLAKMQALNKELGPVLPIDVQESKAIENQINQIKEKYLGDVKPSDLEDPMFQRNLYKTQQEINKLAKSYKEGYEPRYKQAEALKEEISKTKDPIYKEHLNSQLKELYNPSGDKSLAANYNPLTGKYNPIRQLSQFDYQQRPDIEKSIIDTIKSINEDKTAWLGNKPQDIDEYHKSLAKGSNEFISRAKAYKTLVAKSNDRDTIKSLVLQNFPNTSLDQLNEITEQEILSNKIQRKDKEGNIYYDFNPNTISGNLLQSYLTAAEFNKQEKDRNILTDPLARQKGAKEETLRSLRGGAGIDEINIINDAPGLRLFDSQGQFDSSKLKIFSGVDILAPINKIMNTAVERISQGAIKEEFAKTGNTKMKKEDIESLTDIANWAKDNGIKSITPQNINEIAKNYYNDVANKTLETAQSYQPNDEAIKNINNTYIKDAYRLGNATVYGKGTKLSEELDSEQVKDIKFEDFVFRGGEPYMRVTTHEKDDKGKASTQGKSVVISITDNTLKQPFKHIAEVEESIRQAKRSGYSDKLSLVSKEDRDLIKNTPSLQKAMGVDAGYKLIDVISSPEGRATKYVIAKGKDIKVFGITPDNLIAPMSWTDAKVDLGNNILYDRKLIQNPPKEYEDILED